MSLLAKVKMSPSKGQENGPTTGHERKRIEQVGSDAQAVRKANVSRQRLDTAAPVDAAARQPSQREAGAMLNLSTRQIKRLLKVYRQKGAVGLVSKHRGRKGNNRLSERVKKQALDLLKTKYRGFGPTLAHEKLVEKDKFQLSDESVLDKHQHFAQADDRGRLVESTQNEKGCDTPTARTPRLLWGISANGWFTPRLV